MFLKQYNYKPRQGSQSSGSDATEQRTPVQTTNVESAQPAATASAAAGRRRSSGQFAGLNSYKRNSNDERRASIQEQAQGNGVLGQMWTNFTKGGR